MDPHYTYAFVRMDLSVDQQIIQVGHAVHGAALLARELFTVPHMVLFQVKDEAELLAARGHCVKNDILHHVFYEPDHDLGYTALATIPLIGAPREHFRNFRLFESFSAEDAGLLGV